MSESSRMSPSILPRLLALLLLASAGGPLRADGYRFTPLAYLGAAAPGGGTFRNGFQPTAINEQGEVAFTADLLDSGEEGVFLSRNGRLTELMRYGQPAPGGGTFGPMEFGLLGLNDRGDASLPFNLGPFPQYPQGINVGVYRWSADHHLLSPVLAPNVTLAPNGVPFVGEGGQTGMNNRGAIVFNGLIPSDKGIHFPSEPYVGLAQGIYVQGQDGRITAAVGPGDSAPGGGTFDFAISDGLNDLGDMSFAAHVAGTPCGDGSIPQSIFISCTANIYVRKASTRAIRALARVGDPMPGGGVFTHCGVSFMNNAGNVGFFAQVGFPPDGAESTVLFFNSHDRTIRIAGPGDPMPGGGHIAALFGQRLNDLDDVAFQALLDTGDEGIYLYSHGTVRLIVKSGTVLPSLGTVFNLEQGNPIGPGQPPPQANFPWPFWTLNRRGQVAFGVLLTDGRDVLLLATPHSQPEEAQGSSE